MRQVELLGTFTCFSVQIVFNYGTNGLRKNLIQAPHSLTLHKARPHWGESGASLRTCLPGEISWVFNQCSWAKNISFGSAERHIRIVAPTPAPTPAPDNFIRYLEIKLPFDLFFFLKDFFKSVVNIKEPEPQFSISAPRFRLRFHNTVLIRICIAAFMSAWIRTCCSITSGKSDLKVKQFI